MHKYNVQMSHYNIAMRNKIHNNNEPHKIGNNENETPQKKTGPSSAKKTKWPTKIYLKAKENPEIALVFHNTTFALTYTWNRNLSRLRILQEQRLTKKNKLSEV